MQIGASQKQHGHAIQSSGPLHCTLCNMHCNSTTNYAMHLAGGKHRSRVLWDAVGSADAMVSNKGGIEVSGHQTADTVSGSEHL